MGSSLASYGKDGKKKCKGMENINAALASGGQASLALDLSQAKKKAKRRVVAVKTGMPRPRRGMPMKMMILTLMMTMRRRTENRRKVLPSALSHRLWNSKKVKKTIVMKIG